jgi:hypothetical protein
LKPINDHQTISLDATQNLEFIYSLEQFIPKFVDGKSLPYILFQKRRKLIRRTVSNYIRTCHVGSGALGAATGSRARPRRKPTPKKVEPPLR